MLPNQKPNHLMYLVSEKQKKKEEVYRFNLAYGHKNNYASRTAFSSRTR